MTPPPSVAAQVRLIVTERGGTPAGGEEELVEEVRSRLKVPQRMALGKQAKLVRFEYGAAPLINYGRRSIDAGEFLEYTASDLGDLVFELFRAVAHRTRLVSQYADVLDNDADWTTL